MVRVEINKKNNNCIINFSYLVVTGDIFADAIYKAAIFIEILIIRFAFSKKFFRANVIRNMNVSDFWQYPKSLPFNI